MAENSSFVSQLVQRSLSGYAAAAAERLFQQHPEVAQAYGNDSFGSWRAHLAQRLEELSAALAMDAPDLFAHEVGWTKSAFMAREVSAEHLRVSLESLRDTLEESLPPGRSELAVSYITEALTGLAESNGDPSDDEGVTDRRVFAYLEAALEGDRRRAIKLLTDAVDDGLEVERAYLDVLVPAQREVGRLWHGHQLGIAQEHFVTATTQAAMAVLSNRAEAKPAHGKTVMAVAISGNAHDLGVRIVADMFELEGWKAIWLSGSLPISDLVLALDGFRPDLVALSASLLVQLPNAETTIKALKAEDGALKLLAGGRAFSKHPELALRFGADACETDLERALVTAAGLVGLG